MTVWTVTPERRPKLVEKWGELHLINQRYCYNEELKADGSLPDMFMIPINKAAEEFKTETDYLLMNGDHAQVMQMLACLLTLYDAVRILRFDKKIDGFAPILIKG